MVADRAVQLHKKYQTERACVKPGSPTNAYYRTGNESPTLMEAELTELESHESMQMHFKEINCLRTTNGPVFFAQKPSRAPKVQIEDSILDTDDQN